MFIPGDDLDYKVVQGILIHLPINPNLVQVGLASKDCLAPTIFCGTSFAHQHVKHQLVPHKTCYLSVTDYTKNWLALPAIYQAFIFGKLLSIEEDYPLRPHGEDDPDFCILDRVPTFRVPDLFKTLLSNQYYLESASAAKLAFCYAASLELFEVVEQLLKNPKVDPTSLGNYALLEACRNNDVATVEVLLSDSRLRPPCPYSVTVAIDCDHVEIVRLLLAAGANPIVQPVQ
ncbi:UNVERIFIED_CONTAM: hypothetical protein HDU68_006752 [Siphonaria sp. JEL0065]|nr:hypothetical protein HDU68_006752 [Siphonaria sp. JEL0065]